jgi:hypothetical protein
MSPQDIANGIAEGAQKNLDGLDVISIGPMWANDVDGQTYIEVYAVLPKDGGKDFGLFIADCEPEAKSDVCGHLQDEICEYHIIRRNGAPALSIMLPTNRCGWFLAR